MSNLTTVPQRYATIRSTGTASVAMRPTHVRIDLTLAATHLDPVRVQRSFNAVLDAMMKSLASPPAPHTPAAPIPPAEPGGLAGAVQPWWRVESERPSLQRFDRHGEFPNHYKVESRIDVVTDGLTLAGPTIDAALNAYQAFIDQQGGGGPPHPSTPATPPSVDDLARIHLEISDVTFFANDTAEADAEAVRLATANARGNADQLAAGFGLQIVSLRSARKEDSSWNSSTRGREHRTGMLAGPKVLRMEMVTTVKPPSRLWAEATVAAVFRAG